jgi:hypothetical protein
MGQHILITGRHTFGETTNAHNPQTGEREVVVAMRAGQDVPVCKIRQIHKIANINVSPYMPTT